MHDDWRLVGDRLSPALTTRVVPAIYQSSVPFTVEMWRVPDEAIPFAQAMEDAVWEPFEIGTARPSSIWGSRTRGPVTRPKRSYTSWMDAHQGRRATSTFPCPMVSIDSNVVAVGSVELADDK